MTNEYTLMEYKGTYGVFTVLEDGTKSASPIFKTLDEALEYLKSIVNQQAENAE